MPEQRMSAHLTRLAKKRGRLPALVTAGLIAALILVQSLVSSLFAWLFGNLYQRVSFGAVAFDDVVAWQPNFIIEPFLTVTLPFAIGVFLSLWLVAPLAAELTLPFVITRALLASAAGAILTLVVTFVVDLVQLIGLGFDLRSLAHSAVVALGQTVDVFIYTTPIVILACVLLWLWLRENPRDYEVTGLVDEL